MLESFKYATHGSNMFREGKCLQKLGRATNVSPSGNVIVRTDNPPKIGSEVVDENLNVVGKVFDLIGPVSAPYALIKTSVKEPAKLVNKPVYLLLSKTKRSRERE
jgi:RNA-binding protein